MKLNYVMLTSGFLEVERV